MLIFCFVLSLITLWAAPASSVNRNISILNITSTSFIISWQPPPLQSRNSVLTRFVVSLKNTMKYGFPNLLDNSPTLDNSFVIPIGEKQIYQNRQQSVDVTGLEEDFTYDVKIQACTGQTMAGCHSGNIQQARTKYAGVPLSGALVGSVHNWEWCYSSFVFVQNCKARHVSIFHHVRFFFLFSHF